MRILAKQFGFEPQGGPSLRELGTGACADGVRNTMIFSMTKAVEQESKV